MSLLLRTPQLNFESIWLNRWNQNIDEALRGLAFVQEEKGWQELEFPMLENAAADEFDDLAEALILKSSFLRAQGKQKESGQLIGKIYRFFQKNNLKMSFHLCWEVALNFWLTEDYQKAIEYFLLAERKADSKIQLLFCHANLLWNLEALDLERTNVERKLEELLQDLMDQASTGVRGIHEQYQVYLLRKRFYSGSLSILDLEPFLQFSGKLTQSVFFSFFANRLTYFSGERETGVSDNVEMLGQSYLWQGSYRMRTLEAVLVPSDRYLFRCGDAIDRLYLWTWMLMAEHPKMSLEKIEVTLSSLEAEIDLDRLSTENRLLLRNAVRWLLILAPRAAASFRPLIERRFDPSPRYKLLEDEFLFADLLVAGKGSLDTAGMSFHFPRIAREIMLVRKNLEPAESLLLPRLARVLIEDRKLENTENGDIALVIDMATCEVRQVRTGGIVRSKGLCELFSRLKSHTSIPIRELGEDLFENRRRLYNLIARARSLAPLAGIGVEGDSVICACPDELKVYLTKQDLMARQQGKASRIAGRSAGAREKIVSEEAARVIFKMEFSRNEIEKSFRVSKAKACRVLADWLEQGSVEKYGNGKTQMYRWRTP